MSVGSRTYRTLTFLQHRGEIYTAFNTIYVASDAIRTVFNILNLTSLLFYGTILTLLLRRRLA